MPKRAPRPCTKAGCRNLTTTGRCHEHPRERRISGGYNRHKGNRHAQGYGSTWNKLRKRILLRDGYLCQVCRKVDATQVDHIVPKANGGTDDESNLQSICGPCHRTKTARES